VHTIHELRINPPRPAGEVALTSRPCWKTQLDSYPHAVAASSCRFTFTLIHVTRVGRGTSPRAGGVIQDQIGRMIVLTYTRPDQRW
jgi:hypothetical protein